MSIAVGCPCGYVKDFGDEFVTCPVCGLDQSPLRNLHRTVSVVGRRFVRAELLMFAAGILVSILAFAAVRMFSLPRHSVQVARTATIPTEQAKIPQAPSSESRSLNENASVRYVVKAGDSWWRIAALHYGNGEFWPYAAGSKDGQKPKPLVPGQVIELRTINVVPKE